MNAHKKTVGLVTRLRPRGEVQIDVHRDGKLIQKLVVRNTITFDGLNAFLVSLIAPSTNYALAKLVPGTNGTPPTVGDVAMGAPLGSGDQLPLTSPNFAENPSLNELVVTATLGLTQGNGQTLREVGLVLGNGQLFARQIHPPIPKSGVITVTYTWRIASTS